MFMVGLIMCVVGCLFDGWLMGWLVVSGLVVSRWVVGSFLIDLLGVGLLVNHVNSWLVGLLIGG